MQSVALREKATSGQMVALIAGIVTLLFAFVVPMDILGMYYMFTVHMIQHLLLSLATPLLFLLSVPRGRIGGMLGRHQTLKRVVEILDATVSGLPPLQRKSVDLARSLATATDDE